MQAVSMHRLISKLAKLLATLTLMIAAPAWSQSEAPALIMDHVYVNQDDGPVSHVRILGPEGGRPDRWVALVPSLGRGVEDFLPVFGSSLAQDLARRGFGVLLIQPRGIGQSTGTLNAKSTTMELLSGDMLKVIDAFGIPKVSLVGHAFGNRLSRYFSATRPDRVEALVLLAAGGDFELSKEQRDCLLGSFNPSSSDEERLTAIACAFFAKGNDPSVWLEGWHPALAMAQANAALSVASDEFKRAGGVPFLLVQPEQDFIAPRELAGQALKQELGDQVTYVEVKDAGHALLPEQPEELARIVGDYLDQRTAEAAN